MNKSVLLLINGFGVERANSVDIYSATLMPNLDKMTNEALFGQLQTNAGDYNNGYRLFSVSEKAKNKEDEIDNLIYDKKLGENAVLNEIHSNLTKDNKLHVFYHIEDGVKWNQIKEFIKIINPNKDMKVFIHFILTSASISNYKDLKQIISKAAFQFTEYSKIGFVVGKNKLNTDDTLRTFYREYGESWNESIKKFEILESEVINPEDAGVFIISKGFALAENDLVLFLNYNDIEINKFCSDFVKLNLKVYSLYELDGAKNMFTRPNLDTANTASLIEKFNIKLLVLTETSRINDLNFYLNGMKKVKSKNIVYGINDKNLFATLDSTSLFFKSNVYDGYILDFNIGNYTKTEDIKNELAKIDTIIGNIREVAKANNITFIISSTYGMHANVLDGVVQKVADFSGKVPCVFESNEFTRSEYALSSGNTQGLRDTFLTSINDEVKSNKLVHKLSKLDKMLKKK